ncbi:MAG: hypothetical protein ACW960_13610 [Candidatus Thorarchaeota archaeon]
MRVSKKLFEASLALTTVFLLLSATAIIEVSATPIGDNCFLGLLASDSSIDITHAMINLTITSEASNSSPYLLHNIQLDGKLEMTNFGSKKETILLLYSPCWGGPSIPFNGTDYYSHIEGISIVEDSTLANITHPFDLPFPFSTYFPEWVISHEILWYSPTLFVLTNISLEAGNSAVFSFFDTIQWTSEGLDQSAIGFGFMSEQVTNDSTVIDSRIRVPDTWRFIQVWCSPDDGFTSSQTGDEYVGSWSIEPPFTSRFLLNAGPSPISAGFKVTLVQHYSGPPSISLLDIEVILLGLGIMALTLVILGYVVKTRAPEGLFTRS